jgi:hypothetical protein
VGALVAKRLGLHDLDIPKVYRYAVALVRDSKQSTKADVGDSMTTAQETLAAFVNENVNNALVAPFTPRGSLPERPAVSPKGPLRMRYDPNSRELSISVAEFRKFFSLRQVDVRDSVAKLTAAKFLKNNGLSVPVRIGAGAVGGLSGIAVRCYVFDGDAIGVDETAFPSPDA